MARNSTEEINRASRPTTQGECMKLKHGNWEPDVAQLKKLFPNMKTEYVARILHRPYEAVKKFASRHGLRKSAKYMRSLRRLTV